MSDPRQWLKLGLDALPAEQADRVLLVRSLIAAASMLRGRLDRAMAPSGVTTQQAALLQFVDAQAQPPTLGTVAAGLGMTHQNAKQIAAALERKGLLAIAVDPADRRARRLQPTDAMRALWAERNPGDFARVEDWTATLAADEVHQAVALLQRLISGLAADAPAADAPDPAPTNAADRPQAGRPAGRPG